MEIGIYLESIFFLKNPSASSILGTISGTTISWTCNSINFPTVNLAAVSKVRFFIALGILGTVTVGGVNTSISCFLKDTHLRMLLSDKTETIETLVQEVRVGDTLVTSSGRTKVVAIKCIKTRDEKDMPFKIPKDHFAEGEPYQDTFLSKNHAIFTPWNTLVHVEHAGFSKIEKTEEIEYYHVATQDYAHDLIYANGLLSETWDKDILIAKWSCDADSMICIRYEKTCSNSHTRFLKTSPSIPISEKQIVNTNKRTKPDLCDTICENQIVNTNKKQRVEK